MLTAILVSCTCSGVMWAGTTPLPRLIFEIGEGFENSLVSSTRSRNKLDNFTVLDAQLANINAALDPLTTAYNVDVLIYPCHMYNATAPGALSDPLKRISPGLLHLFDYFESLDKIGVFLEVYSSGIMTQQVGPRMGTLPPTPLYNATSRPGYIGLSIDVEVKKS